MEHDAVDPVAHQVGDGGVQTHALQDAAHGLVVAAWIGFGHGLRRRAGR